MWEAWFLEGGGMFAESRVIYDRAKRPGGPAAGI